MLSIQNTKAQLKVAQVCKAIRDGFSTKVTKRLLENTVDVNDLLPDQYSLETFQSKFECSTLLHLAYVKKDIEQFELLIKFGADCTIKDQDGSTILHHIIKDIQQENAGSWLPLSNSFVNVILLAHIENQNYANPYNKSGLSHFHVASMANQVELVKLFIDNGISIDQSIEVTSPIKPGYSAMHFAAEYCSLETMQFLISNEASMHLKNASGLTPLHLLVKTRLEMFCSRYPCKKEKSIVSGAKEVDLNEKMMNFFLENDSTDTDCMDDIGLTNFHVACLLQSSTVECLLDQVVDINQRVNQDSPLCPGYTALHFAAHCNVKTVILLIEGGADMTACDAKGVTPLDICIKWFKVEDMSLVANFLPLLWHNITFSNNKTKLLDCIYAMLNSDKLKKFLQDNIDLNIYLPQTSPIWPGSTPLHLAFRFNKQQMVYSLLEIHGRVWKRAFNILDKDCLSYLHIACSDTEYGHRLALKILVKRSVRSIVNAAYKGQPLAKLKPGWSSLHVAAVEGQESLVKALLESGADVNCKDSQGFSPIHRMFNTTNKKIVELLLASKNLQECVVEGAGLTHLHVATWFRNNKGAARLLKMGANIECTIKCEIEDENLKELEGCTPLHLAMIKCDTTNVRLFFKFGANILAKRSDGVSPLSQALTTTNDVLKFFWELIQNDKKLQKRLEKGSGLTMLHIACRLFDVNIIETLLREKCVDVNAKTRDDLNFWPGFTPLHVFVEWHSSNFRKKQAFNNILELLLINGADVTATNADLCTPVHVQFKMCSWRSSSTAIKSMLKYQRDFSVNPVDKDGLSHFHCACAKYDLDTVEKYLHQGHIDVNQQIDFFVADNEHPGYSPLHLVLSSKITNFKDNESQQRIVELLLEHGAKVNLEDSSGHTPLHVLIQEIENPWRFSLMKIILSHSKETDVNMRTISGKTPMEILLSAQRLCKDVAIWFEEIELLISSGGCINSCNPITEEGYIALAFSINVYNVAGTGPRMFQLIKRVFGLSGVDETNRNSIHNVVATSHHSLTQKDYEVIINLSIQTGCDIDQKDGTGKTPLHLAVQFGNLNAVGVLLDLGADINIIDSSGMSAFSYTLKDSEKINYCMISKISLHVHKLIIIGIEISKLNESLLTKALKEYNVAARFSDLSKFYDKIKETENVKIGRRELTLRSFLFETAAISVYPSLMPIEREEIVNFFKFSDDIYPELNFAILLQYRKVMQRSSLIAEARNSFKALLNFPLPDLCIEIVLKFLRNSDLKNLIATYDVEDGMNMVVD